jgi:protein-S-isoprenylcysteine O-methyltransferase Ste14
VTGLPVDVGLAVCWGVVALEWVTGALYNAFHVRGARTQDLRGQVVVVGVALVCAILVVVSRSYLDELTIGAVWVRVLGLVMLVASTVFTLWARISLGSMWSLGSTVRNDHQLRTTGPYGVTRHPIYTGLVGMLIGTTLLAGAGQWIVLFPVGLILLELKIHTEGRARDADERTRQAFRPACSHSRAAAVLASLTWPPAMSAGASVSGIHSIRSASKSASGDPRCNA